MARGTSTPSRSTRSSCASAPSGMRYDLVVFALIDSLTVQSSFSGVRLESYMFTQESFDAVRDHLKPGGVMALYNYFREKWLVDRLAKSLTTAFGDRGAGA